jgi:hypothetical protein
MEATIVDVGVRKSLDSGEFEYVITLQVNVRTTEGVGPMNMSAVISPEMGNYLLDLPTQGDNGKAAAEVADMQPMREDLEEDLPEDVDLLQDIAASEVDGFCGIGGIGGMGEEDDEVEG